MTTVPIGPIHPILKEPIRLKLVLEGEKPVDAEIEMGYVHRGIEKIMEGKHVHKCVHLAERVCGICSFIHTMTFVECVEKISKIEIPEKAKYLRVISSELERIHSHLLINSVYCLSIEHETLGLWLLNVREKIMDLMEMITGNRINMSYNVVGGVRRDINKEYMDKIYKTLDIFEEEIKNLINAFETAPLVGLRSKGIGVLDYKEIMRTRVTGPMARASALPESDWRLRHSTYKELKSFKPVWREEGDNFARCMVRFDEIKVSVDIIRECLELYEECGGNVREKCHIKGGDGEKRNEAPRGEVVYKMELSDNGIIKRIMIRTPSIMNFEAYKYMLKTCPTVADAVATFISLDPCVACAERAITIVRK
ncbi:nickel-dependent hydrogenase large subunit [Methanocaldococcus indicus]|uniref:hydrogenase large subunit n=1 Tax=Methanocaldococcus indicus TaxID=213231 RepID=UPI003C6CF2F0